MKGILPWLGGEARRTCLTCRRDVLQILDSRKLGKLVQSYRVLRQIEEKNSECGDDQITYSEEDFDNVNRRLGGQQVVALANPTSPRSITSNRDAINREREGLIAQQRVLGVAMKISIAATIVALAYWKGYARFIATGATEPKSDVPELIRAAFYVGMAFSLLLVIGGVCVTEQILRNLGD